MPGLYLCYFAHRLLSFRETELQQLQLLWQQTFDPQQQSSPLNFRLPKGHTWLSPFRFVDFRSDKQIAWISARAILLKGIYQLWGTGETFPDLKADIQQQVGLVHQEQWSSASFKVHVDTWGHTTDQAEQVALIEQLSFLPLQGRVQLKDPDLTFRLIITRPSVTDNGLPETPHSMFFGREVAAGCRKMLYKYALPQRRYLGPTSMDTELSFIMCNHALVRPGSLVFDPYAGTGSILVAAAHLGAQTLGCDIDMRVIRDGKQDSKGKAVDVWTNFREYGLRPPVGLMRADSHLPPFRPGLQEVIDAIICDPPYGVRAGGRKSKSSSAVQFMQAGEVADGAAPRLLAKHRPGYVPPTEPYTLAETLADLLHMAARLLRIGGRLVVFLPSLPEASMQLHHACLQQIACCEQTLTTRYSRCLLTLEKVSCFDEQASLASIAAQREAFTALDNMHDLIFKAKIKELNGTGPPGHKAPFRSKVL